MWPFKKKSLTKKQQQQDDYINLGKQVMILYDHINPDRKGLFLTAFLKGIFTGVGSVIGASIVIALLAWLLSVLGQVPFIGPITDSVRGTIENR